MWKSVSTALTVVGFGAADAVTAIAGGDPAGGERGQGDEGGPAGGVCGPSA